MASNTFLLGGASKATVVNTVLTVASGATPDLGAFQIDQFGRVECLASVTGSFTFRYRMGVSSGTWLVSSTFVINSGGSVFDFFPYGRVADFDFTSVVSNIATIYISGHPTR